MWRDGTSHLRFEPIECMDTLATRIPRPAVSLVVYHAVLAPQARWRRQAVSHDRPAPDPNAQAFETSPRDYEIRAMKFGSACGSDRLEFRVPDGDTLPRFVCAACGTIA